MLQNHKLPKSISAKELNELINSAKKIQIIDVREHFEWDICHIEGALNIPMNLIVESIFNFNFIFNLNIYPKF